MPPRTQNAVHAAFSWPAFCGLAACIIIVTGLFLVRILAAAVQNITQAFVPLYNARKISARELIRLVYKFLAETPPETIPDEESPVQG